ncbi:MAG TPA: carboxypeptidase regulatory-like domain-containing protein [Planctomycetes bacterium]|nr:carboxypeptidase regulatory-like domain-containing protein [Planctomycetota bacterium]
MGGRILLLRKEGSSKTMGSTVTDEKGRFRVESLAPGNYRVYLRPLFKPAAGEPVGRSEPFQVREGMSPLKIQVPVQPAAAIQGSLDRPPAKGAVVIARVEGWLQPFHAKVDPAGLFRIGGLPPGKTKLKAICGKLRGSLELLTSPGETTRVVIHLQPK